MIIHENAFGEQAYYTYMQMYLFIKKVALIIQQFSLWELC